MNCSLIVLYEGSLASGSISGHKIYSLVTFRARGRGGEEVWGRHYFRGISLFSEVYGY